jgi:hypothetical protein
MRIRAFLNSGRTQLTIVLGLVLALAAAGCGGGGGGSSAGNGNGNGGGNTGGNGGGTTNPELATITGQINDTSPNHNPVQGATITVPGTSRTATTNASGAFVLTNVPLTATSFKVAAPSGGAYFNYANYNGHEYDLTACVLQLPVLIAGANAPFSEIDMYIGGNNPPPPPPVGGCPS